MNVYGKNPTPHAYSVEETQKVQFEVDSKFQQMMSSMSDYAFFTLNGYGKVESWNKGAQNVHGYSDDEVLGEFFSKFYSEEDIEKNLPQKHLELANRFSGFEEERWMLRKDGKRFWAKFNIASFRNENSVSGYGIMIHDLTKYKENEDKVRQSEEVFRRIFDGIKDYAIFTLDLNGNVTSWNEGAKRIKGYESHEVLGKNFSIFYLHEDITTGKCSYELEEALTTGRYEEEGWRRRKDGTFFWASVVLSVIRNEKFEPIGFTKITRDMTDRKRAEDLLKMSFSDLEKKIDKRTNELITTNLKLQEAIKIRDEFLSVASHELKTPLTPLKLQTQMISKSIKSGLFKNYDEKKLQKIIGVFEMSINRLSSLVDNLLDVSRLSHKEIILQKEEMNLKTFFEQVMEHYRSAIDLSKSEVRLLAPEDVVGLFDSLRIEQVFSNLLTNALKYGDQKPITITLKKINDQAVLTFQDQGIGIPEVYKSKIFDRYEKIEDHRNISGLGLGLYIIKEIVVAHGGKIDVESEVGKGTSFEVVLPLC